MSRIAGHWADWLGPDQTHILGSSSLSRSGLAWPGPVCLGSVSRVQTWREGAEPRQRVLSPGLGKQETE